MSRNTSVTIGDHFSDFASVKIKSELEILREKLIKSKIQADKGETVDGESFMQGLMAKNG